jgi:hypothetical protein
LFHFSYYSRITDLLNYSGPAKEFLWVVGIEVSKSGKQETAVVEEWPGVLVK